MKSSFNQDAIASAITASTDSAQASIGDADEIQSAINIVATVASAGDSLTLPLQVPPGAQVTVKNQAANSMDLFPGLAGTINGGTANAALAVTNDISVTLVLDQLGINWEVISNSDDSPA